MTDTDVLATLERLLGEATPGPWEHHTLAVTNGRETILQTGISNSFRPPRPRECEANAALIALLRNAAPALLEVAKAARKAETTEELAKAYTKGRKVPFNLAKDALDAKRALTAALRALDKVSL